MKGCEIKATTEQVRADRNFVGKSNLRTVVVTLAVTVFVWSGVARESHGHPVSIMRALVFVGPHEASVTVEAFVEDLYLFHSLQPDETNRLSSSELARGIELHRSFVAEHFVIRDAEGRVFPPSRPVEVEASLPAEGIDLAELMTHKLTFDLRFSFAEPPDFLTFEQTFGGLGAVLPAELHLQVKQHGGPELARLLLERDQPLTIRLDWSGDQPTDDSSEQERAAWLKEQSEQTLGISSYSSVYAFLYVEEFEVRLEVLLPLLTTEEMTELPRKDKSLLSVAEQDSVAPAIARFFTDHTSLTVNNRRRMPEESRCDFYGVRFRDFAERPGRRDVAMSSGRVGLILSWRTSQPVQNVKLDWDVFSSNVRSVKLNVIQKDSIQRRTLTRIGGRNSFELSDVHPVAQQKLVRLTDPVPRPMVYSVPLVSVACLVLLGWLATRPRRGDQKRVWLSLGLLLTMFLGAGMPSLSWQFKSGYRPVSESQASAICRALLPRTYVAFDYRRETDIYDALAATVGGELLPEIYLSLLDGIRMPQQGGAVAQISEVTVLDGDLRESPGTERLSFRYFCTWNVAGNVEHWGHIHNRVNQFSGVATVQYLDNSWKLTGLDVADETQLSFSTGLRRFVDQ